MFATNLIKLYEVRIILTLKYKINKSSYKRNGFSEFDWLKGSKASKNSGQKCRYIKGSGKSGKKRVFLIV